ncbi:MAG: hypothetical protein IRY97_04760 [Thermomicrobiaceae bacterium]|nr:hypothetical protein [Thermomicrobiaceae bacterium]
MPIPRRPNLERRLRRSSGARSAAKQAVLGFAAIGFIGILVYLLTLSSRTTITKLSPSPMSKTPPGVVEVGATVSSAKSLRQVAMTIDGQAVQPRVDVRGERTWVVSFSSVFARGKHEVSVSATDAEGKVHEHSWSFEASGPRLTPAITFLGPPSGEKIAAGPVSITVTITNTDSVRAIKMLLNGKEIEPAVTANAATQVDSSGSASVGLQAQRVLTEGDYTVDVAVTDDRGEETRESARFTVVKDPAKATARYFADSGIYVRNPFKAFWESHDGPNVFGNPVSPEFVDDRGVTVQYFENARFERGPNGSVNLGRLGVEALGQIAPKVKDPHRPDISYFPETGHTLAGKFRDYWNQHGGVAIFGFPITEVTDENDTKVQYFERARLELRPSEDGSGMKVWVTPLGAQAWAARSHGS